MLHPLESADHGARDSGVVDLGLVGMLKEYHVDTNSWGTGGAKSIVDLSDEIRRGESRVHRNESTVVARDGTVQEYKRGICRDIFVVEVDVMHETSDGAVLHLVKSGAEDMTTAEELDGQLVTVAVKSSSVTGKPPEAASALLRQTLGIGRSGIAAWERTLAAIDIENSSAEYPGIKKVQATWRFLAMLTDASYQPEGYASVGDESSRFVWE